MRIRPVNMEFLYGTAFMSQSPEAYERLILDAMRGEATLFTRNDEVDAQWSIIDPILKAWKDGSPAMSTYEAGSAGPGRGGGADRRRPPLEGAVSDEQEPWDDAWWEEDTTPAKIEAALREMLATRHHESHAFVPARVLNLVVIADNEYRGEIQNRLQRVGRYHPSRLVLCSVSEGRDTIDARVEIGTSQFAGPGHIAVGRERIVLHIGPKHLRQARHDRRPAARARPRDDRVGAARPRRGRRRAAPARADRAAGLAGRADA